MIFGRRAAPRWPDRIRQALWPPIGWRRALAYQWHRLARMQASPHAVAAGLASGVAVSITPLLGLQFLLAGTLAAVCRGSVLAAIAGTFFANPWTLPFIWFATFELGGWMLFGDPQAAIGSDGLAATFAEAARALRARDVGSLEAEVWPILLSMIVGSLPLGAFAWGVTYWPVRRLVRRYRIRRQARLRVIAAGAAPRRTGADLAASRR